jgi:hypothetical protein
VTAVTMPGRRSLAGKLGETLRDRARAKGKPGRLAAFLTLARPHVMTAAALAAMDFGAFTVWHHGGWFAVCVSLLALDFAITG